MRRQANRLTVATIKAALRRAPADGKLMLPDGNGLYLQIKHRVPSWVYRYALQGRTGWMGLGALDQVDLATARDLADDARRLKRKGIDPLAHRRADRQTAAVNSARAVPSFAECARRYLAAHRAAWKSAAHAAQWASTLEAYVFPVFGKLPVDTIDTGLVLRALEPVWQDKPATGSRVRARIENVLHWAKAADYRKGDNPARWKGHLEILLPNPVKLNGHNHFAALPHSAIGTLLTELRQGTDIPAFALEFAILTASRSGEVLGARWEEIDLGQALWTVPAERMKADREHRGPLSAQAVVILDRMRAQRQTGDLVFPGNRPGRPLGHTALRRRLEALKTGAGLTVHGFRSTFRVWAAELTSFPAEIAEMALAHQVGTATEKAYMRSDMFDKRRQLADAWARYCERPAPGGLVVPIGTARR